VGGDGAGVDLGQIGGDHDLAGLGWEHGAFDVPAVALAQGGEGGRVMDYRPVAWGASARPCTRPSTTLSAT
jgi:hypothetical protein